MTRINAGVHPFELPDKLLLAEHREIVRIPNAVRSGRAVLEGKIPKDFTLGTGHVRFFYDKIGYLLTRYLEIFLECEDRDFNVTWMGGAFREIPDKQMNNWSPTTEARRLIIERIESKGFSLRRCQACPFRDGENKDATVAQNLGCLPSARNMIKLFDEEGVSLSCHNDDEMPCRGLSSVRNTKNTTIKAYTDWYHNG